MGREAEDGPQSSCVHAVEQDYRTVYELERGHGGRLLGHLQRSQSSGDEARKDGPEEGVRDVCDDQQHSIRKVCTGRGEGERTKAWEKVKPFASFSVGKLLNEQPNP